MEAAYPPALAILGGALSIPLVVLGSRGMPTAGEARAGERAPAGPLFHLAIAVLSIGLLWFMPMARDPLSRLEPFASHRALLEWTCALIHVLAVGVLLGFLAAAAPRNTAPRYAFTRSLGRFMRVLLPLLLVQLCILWGARAIGRPAPAQQALVAFERESWDVRLGMAALIAVAAPIAEETIFRGALHPALSRVIGADLSRLATSVVFGALHGLYACVPIALFGHFLARVRDADGRLLPCVGLHSLYNLLMLALFTAFPQVRDLYQPSP